MKQFNSKSTRDLIAARAWAACLIVTLFLSPRPLTAQDDAFPKLIAPFLKQHCVACHGPEKQESRIRFDQLTGVQAGNRNLWTMVHQQLSVGDMPPKDRPQPDDVEKKKVLTWIGDKQRALGAGGTRRLNRRELSAALRDVTGLMVDFSFALPGDGTVAGFDTGAEGLQEASDSVEQWLQITRRAVEGLRFLDPAKGKVFAVNLREVKDARKAFEEWKNAGATIRSTGGIGRPGLGLLIDPKAVGEREMLSVSVPAPADRQGVLRLTLVVSAMKPVKGVPNPHLWVEIGGKDIDFREITGTLDQPQRLVYEVQLGDLVVQKGVSIHLSNKVEIPYGIEGFENEERNNPKDPIPGGTGLFRPAFDKKSLPPEKQPIPYIVLQSIEIVPEHTMRWPPAEWKSSIGEIKDDPAFAKQLLSLWIDRAWRRPATEAEQTPFLTLYQTLRNEKKMSFDGALRAAFQSVLLSAPFRYQASPAHPNPIVAQHAIASRLSFMLVGAPPDAQLRRLAAEGKLREPAVLDAEVDRLIADPRSQAFVRPFVMQWLEMEQPITIAQSHINKQDFRFARYYKASMREETIAYIAQLFAENRPAKELIVSDWTMMNDALAIHYGYEAIEGGELRKVKLRADDPRGGGILGHAGLQSMLCWMGENWVIYRGAWALRHILDHPPPPPPLEVPELNPSDGKNKGIPFRQLLKQHQEDRRCAVCHKSIDPAGFAFQNFDISGRWRDVEYESYKRSELDGRIAWRGVGATRPVDSTGQLPRGEEFKTFAEFKQVIVKDYQADMVRGVLKNLMVYGVGRSPGIDDMMEITAIMRESRPQGYPLRDMIKSIVRSRAFLEQQLPISETQPNIGRRPE